MHALFPEKTVIQPCYIIPNEKQRNLQNHQLSTSPKNPTRAASKDKDKLLSLEWKSNTRLVRVAERDGAKRLDHGGSGQWGVSEIRWLATDQSDAGRWLVVRQWHLWQRQRARVERTGAKIGRPSSSDPQFGESTGAWKRGPRRTPATCRGRGNGATRSSETVSRINRTHCCQCRGASCEEDERSSPSFYRVSTVFFIIFV